ncbi:unnamed protein product [Musa textilis]
MDVTRGPTCIMSSLSRQSTHVPCLKSWQCAFCSLSLLSSSSSRSVRSSLSLCALGSAAGWVTTWSSTLRPSSKPSPKPRSRTIEQWVGRNHRDTGARRCRDRGERVVQEGSSRMHTAGGRQGGAKALSSFPGPIRTKPPSVERKLGCTLEELCRGCKKEVEFTRDIVTNNGLIVRKEETQTIWINPG